MISKSIKPYQFIISGFHRSGTSFTAQYLNRSGLDLGNNLLGADPSNPDGHFEDQGIMALHQDILIANHRDWYTPGPDLSASAEAFQGRAKALLEQFPTGQSIGFKDPRSCFFLPWWHRQLDNPAAVIIYRHYAGCFHSLRNRQAQSLVFDPLRHKDTLFFWQAPELALELWLSYNNAILDYSKAHRTKTLLVSHHSMLNGFNLPAAVNMTLGLALNTRCDSGIRAGHGKNPELPEKIDSDLKKRLDTTLASLNALCCSEPEPAGSTYYAYSQVSLHQKMTIHTQKELIEKTFSQLHIPLSKNELLEKPTLPKSKHVVPPSITGFAEHSDDVNKLIQWGKEHQAKQNDNFAEACWSKAHSLAPDNVTALLHLALLARDHDENAKSMQHMYAAIKLKPHNVKFHYHLARASYECGKPEQALKLVRRGLNLQHDHYYLQLLRLELLLSDNNHLEAHNACNKALSLFPDDARLMMIMARVAGVNDGSGTAMTWFRRSVLTRIRKYDNYRKTLIQAIELVPANQQSALSSRIIEELRKLDLESKAELHELTLHNKSSSFHVDSSASRNL